MLLRMRNIADNPNAKFFSWKFCRLLDNVEKNGTAEQATDDNKLLRMRLTCLIFKATDTHWYVIFISVPQQ